MGIIRKSGVILMVAILGTSTMFGSEIQKGKNIKGNPAKVEAVVQKPTKKCKVVNCDCNCNTCKDAVKKACRNASCPVKASRSKKQNATPAPNPVVKKTKITGPVKCRVQAGRC